MRAQIRSLLAFILPFVDSLALVLVTELVSFHDFAPRPLALQQMQYSAPK